MVDIISSESINSPLNINNNSVPNTLEEGLMNKIIKKISENKMYIYIGLAVLVLAIVLFYFYMKNKKDTKETDNKLKQEQPIQSIQPMQSQVPQIDGEEYWVIDSQGNPIKVSGKFPPAFQQNQLDQLAPLPIPKQVPSTAEIQMLQKQMLEQQMIEQRKRLSEQAMLQNQIAQQQQALAQAKAEALVQSQVFTQTQASAQSQLSAQAQLLGQPTLSAQAKSSGQKQYEQKLKHPEDSDKNVSDDIDVELARIQANEDDNVAQHNLTPAELAEINKKLEVMNSQINSN